MRSLRASTLRTLAASNQWSTGVSSDALKSPRAIATPIVADVTRREEVRRVVEEALARFGHIDVWVNNAGRGITRLVSELTPVLRELTKAFDTRDGILIGDLLEYEIAPRMERITPLIEKGL